VVKLASGQSFQYLFERPEEYTNVRNRGGILAFKMVYTTFAAIIGGYLTSWLAGSTHKIAVAILISVQAGSLLWAGFFSELSVTGPRWMWIALLILVPVGIYVGHLWRMRKRVSP